MGHFENNLPNVKAAALLKKSNNGEDFVSHNWQSSYSTYFLACCYHNCLVWAS